MNSPATPGPWRLVDHPTDTCKVLGVGETLVASVYCTDLEDGAANAALIAAAPSLRDALGAALPVLLTRVHLERELADKDPDSEAAQRFHRQAEAIYAGAVAALKSAGVTL